MPSYLLVLGLKWKGMHFTLSELPGKKPVWDYSHQSGGWMRSKMDHQLQINNSTFLFCCFFFVFLEKLVMRSLLFIKFTSWSDAPNESPSKIASYLMQFNLFAWHQWQLKMILWYYSRTSTWLSDYFAWLHEVLLR